MTSGVAHSQVPTRGTGAGGHAGAATSAATSESEAPPRASGRRDGQHRQEPLGDDDFGFGMGPSPDGPSWARGRGYFPESEEEVALSWAEWEGAPGNPGVITDRLDRYSVCLVPPNAMYLGSGDYKVVGGDVDTRIRRWDDRRTSGWNTTEMHFVRRPEALERRRAHMRWVNAEYERRRREAELRKEDEKEVSVTPGARAGRLTTCPAFLCWER